MDVTEKQTLTEESQMVSREPHTQAQATPPTSVGCALPAVASHHLGSKILCVLLKVEQLERASLN